MAHVVAVFFVELVVGDFAERGTPEDEAFLEVEPDAFEEEGVLQAPEVLEMGIAAERAVQVLHAEREGRGECVDISRGDVGAREGGRGAGVVGIWGGEVLGEVGEDRCKAIIFVETWESTRCHLAGLADSKL